MLKRLQKISLSNFEVNDLLNDKTKVILYPYLSKINHIDEVLDPYDSCVILYLTRKGYGHWTCLIRNGDKVEFFDPYGYMIDSQLDWDIPKEVRTIYKEDYPYLTELLLDSGYDIHFNQYKLQKKCTDIRTCGRHCVVRIWYKDLDLDDYNKFIRSTEYTPDELVTILTT